jgi:uncharacterized membrane protein YdbT with pleckstrin-like domain
MSYTDRTLLAGEHKIINTTFSYWNLVLGFAIGILLAPITFGLSMIFALLAVIDHYFTEYTVTDRRVLVKRGVIRRRVTEVNVKKVEGVDVRQSVLGRILGYGTVTVRGTGTEHLVIRMVQDPLLVKVSIQNQVDK